jgi:hypothetical protein
MHILVFDTETTGLPPNGRRQQVDPAKWPFIVQLGFVFVDTDSSEAGLEEVHDIIVKVEGDIPTAHIHGITKEINSAQGVPFPEAFAKMSGLIDRADLIVGHNIEFDVGMLEAECLRHGIPFTPPAKQFCTMRRTTDYCGLVSAKGFPKPPKLVELHNILFGEPPSVSHKALSDVFTCLRCFYKFVLKREPPLSFWEEEKKGKENAPTFFSDA